MSHDEIRIVYDLAEDMVTTFNKGTETLQDTMQELQTLANMLEEGALLGRGGNAFVDAIRSQLCPSLSKLTDKMKELEGDVKAAIEFMQESDSDSAGKF